MKYEIKWNIKDKIFDIYIYIYIYISFINAKMYHYKIDTAHK